MGVAAGISFAGDMRVHERIDFPRADRVPRGGQAAHGGRIEVLARRNDLVGQRRGENREAPRGGIVRGGVVADANVTECVVGLREDGHFDVGPALAAGPSRSERHNRDGTPASGGPTTQNFVLAEKVNCRGGDHVRPPAE